MIKKMLATALTLSCAAAIPSVFLLAALQIAAQDKPKRETIQAQAMGQQRAAGKTFNVTINIESYSTPEDQKTLIDAFTSGGHDALVKTLSKMKSKGRVAVTGTLGYQIAYIRSFNTENGRTIRLITDRPIQFREAYASGRTKDYDLSAIEINLDDKDKKQSDGSLIIAGKFKVDKNQQVTFESYGSGPWKLVNIMERN
jgi:hypothetical protein